MAAPKFHVADPMLLASSLRAIRVVLGNIEMREEFIREIVDDLGRMTPLLPYLGNKKYDPLYNLAEKHQKSYDPKRAVEVQAPALAALSNRLVHHAFVAIIELIEFFTAETEDPLCKIVSETLNDQGRETALFTLLDVPSDDVKTAVMKCIEKVQLDQLESEEIGFLLKLMSDSKNIGAGKTEELLKRVIGLLDRLVLDHSSLAGEAFMKDHSEVAIHEIFGILARNEERQTYGNLEEEEEKTLLSLGCISFLRSCGRRLELRRFLRNPQAKQYVIEILKNEDDLHTPSNPDIIVERTMTGTSVETLLISFAGVDRLSANKKVAFRAAQRIADVLEGRSDLLDGTENLNCYTFAKREALMWDDIKMKKYLKYLDDDEWDDRSFQQQSFTSFGGFDRLLIFLDGVFDVDLRVQTARHQDAEQSALKFQYEMEGMSSKIVEEMESVDQAAKDKDEPHEIKIDELDDNPAAQASAGASEKDLKEVSRKMLMGAMQALHRVPPESSVALFLEENPDFEIHEDFFEDEESGRVRPAFIVAAMLRSAYVLLTRNVSEGIRTDITDYLKNADTVRKLLTLIPATGFLNCHVTAKLLRVMTKVLTLPPNVTSESIRTLLLFGMLSNFIKQLCIPALQVLKQTERPLNVHEQVLCAEIARCVEVIGRNIPYIVFSAERQEPQKLCVMRCLERFIPNIVISAITQMVLYDLEANSGSSEGEVISVEFARGSIARKGLQETCSRVIAQHLQHCPPMKYAVLEAFTQAVVFGKQAIRPSYMYDLLCLLNQGQLTGGVDELLKEKHRQDPDNPERVLHLFEVEICTTATTMFRILIVSNLNFYVMDKPSSSMHCGVCPPEKFCPHAPTIERQCSYLDMCRLIKGYGSQACVIGWIKPHGGEEFEHIVCHRSGDRDLLIEMVHTLSAQSRAAEMSDRVKLAGDSLSRAVIQEAVGGDPIFALTYAFRQDKDRLSLFILTAANIYEFKVNFDAFGFDPDLPDAGDAEDEIGPQLEEDPMEIMLDAITKGIDPSVREARLKGKDHGDNESHIIGRTKAGKSTASANKSRAVKERRQEAVAKGERDRLDAVNKGAFGDLGMSMAEKHEALLKKTKTSYLTPLVEQPVSAITMICFMPGDIPVLRLDVGEKMVICFFDDLAREDWRRALACALNQADAASVWARQFPTPGEIG
eukprot:gnl/MRDRNA2_/MRDRNA2_28286_c0_seq1.p1 gnl/MRDRNA2_/MRDRNA2_28286_c0~~gnl/MRDRNA2_/MRDRNA2_28286_c0_seq1.p1  ORF type:complete len:1337 (+),score=272.29 gnl/MRDRNA2_/MRDRNA2_28286_c0_seq1:487-4011(+)